MKNGRYTPTNLHASPRKTPLLRGRYGRAAGQSLFEFSIVTPLLFLLIFGIVDMARLVQAQATVSSAARKGIRYAITGQQERDPITQAWIPRPSTIVSKTLEGLVGISLSNTPKSYEPGYHAVRINPPTDAGRPGQIVEITVYYNIEMLTPMVNLIIPNVLLRGYERSINEEWGAVQSFDHANLPPTPPPLPTWTPFPTNTRTPTWTPVHTATNTPTPGATDTGTPTGTPTSTIPAGSITATPTAPAGSTNTPAPTNTRTHTPGPPNTPTGTSTPIPTGTPTAAGVSVTPTPARRLVIQQIIGKKPDGAAMPLDIQVSLRDELNASVDGATLNATATGSSTWSGVLTGMIGGIYRICNVGSFNGSNGGGISISVTATKPGYQSNVNSADATSGNVSTCP